MFSLRSAFRAKSITWIKCYSTNSKNVDLSFNEQNKIATITLQKLPVNSLNLDVLSELSAALDEVGNRQVRGMILTSASPTVFSAGLDIMEMYKPEEKRLRTFWNTLQDVWLKLYGSSFPTVAAINGHAPAGGCLLSLCCEYRVMMNNFTIGLNETRLGIVAPFWFISAMRNTISKRDAELALTEGKLFSTQEALKIGLVDEIANDKEDLINKTEKFFQRFDKVNAAARQFTKATLRNEDIKQLLDTREADTDQVVFTVGQPRIQKSLEAYINALKAKQNK